MIYLKLLLISLIIVYIIDISGAPENLFKPLIRSIMKLPKNTNLNIGPVECSKCAVWWIGLLYILCTGAFTIPNIAYVCLLSFLTIHIKGMILYIREFLIWIENKMYKIIND